MKIILRMVQIIKLVQKWMQRKHPNIIILQLESFSYADRIIRISRFQTSNASNFTNLKKNYSEGWLAGFRMWLCLQHGVRGANRYSVPDSFDLRISIWQSHTSRESRYVPRVTDMIRTQCTTTEHCSTTVRGICIAWLIITSLGIHEQDRQNANCQGAKGRPPWI